MFGKIRVSVIFALAFLCTFTLAVPCFAKDNAKKDAMNMALEQSGKQKKTEQAKAPEEETKSFKRFEISYEAILLSGTFYEKDLVKRWWPPNWQRGTLEYKNKVANRLRSKTGIYKMAFYFTPKTYLEGAYGTTVFDKKKPGWFKGSLPGVASFGLDDHIDGKSIRLWNADFFQNIYTHKKTGMAVDAFAGYFDYKMDVTIGSDTPAVFIGDMMGGKRTFSGTRFGLRFKGPFTLPDLPKHPFLFKTTVSYAPSLSMKGKDMFLLPPSFQPGFSCKGKGSALETHTGLSFQVNSFLSIEAGYNYYQLVIDKGNYSDVILPATPGFPVIPSIHKIKVTLHGPSVAVTCRF